MPGKVVESHGSSRYIVSGKPYISVNSATRKAANAPNVRQSRGLCGLAKLNANMMKTREFKTTSDHSP